MNNRVSALAIISTNAAWMALRAPRDMTVSLILMFLAGFVACQALYQAMADHRARKAEERRLEEAIERAKAFTAAHPEDE